MEAKTPTEKLRMICAEVINAYSLCENEKYGQFYIKHLGLVDSASVDFVKEKYVKSAKSKGLVSEEEQLKFLIKENQWDESKDAKCKELSGFIKNLKYSKSKLFLRSELDQLDKQIKDAEDELTQIQTEKVELIGLTAETYAHKKINEYYIYTSLFKNPDLKEKYFSQEQFDEIDEQELWKIVEIYNDRMRDFSNVNFKRIALNSFFLNTFGLCKDNPFTFYGKPAVHLTFYQTELFSQGRYFKHILSNSKNKPPADIMDDPDAIIEWYDSSQNAQEAMQKIDKSNVGGSSIVGASKSEMERLGAVSEDEQGVDLIQEAQKKGGSLSMAELMKLHGV